MFATNANGMPYDHISPSETFEQALEMLDYEAFRHKELGTAADQPHRIKYKPLVRN